MESKPSVARQGTKDSVSIVPEFCMCFYTSSRGKGEERERLTVFTLAIDKGVGEGEVWPALG